MNLKAYFLSAIIVGTLGVSAFAGAGQEAVLTAKSESGKVKLIVKTRDTDGPVTKAQLVMDKDTTDLFAKYDIFSVADLPNHILTVCFQDKDLPTDAEGTGSLKVWAIPSSFVKTGNSEFNWRFKLKIGGTVLKDVVKMDGTFEWTP